MKLVIYTQHRENYGAHDWDGEGECPEYWKNKGGDIYVVRNITPKQEQQINEKGILTLDKLICRDTNYFKEYIIEYRVIGNNETPWEKWQSPILLDYYQGNWHAIEVCKNDGWRKEIAKRIRTWTLRENGETEHETCTYVMENGDYVKGCDFEEYMKKVA